MDRTLRIAACALLALALPAAGAPKPTGACEMTKLSNLTAVDAVEAADLVYVCQGGVSMQATVAQLVDVQIAYKTADEVVANGATVLDSELVVDVVAGAIYAFRIWISADSGGNQSYALGGTLTADNLRAKLLVTVGTISPTIKLGSITALDTAVTAGSGSSIDQTILEGTVEVATAGTFGLKCEGLTLHRGSYMRAERIR